MAPVKDYTKTMSLYRDRTEPLTYSLQRQAELLANYQRVQEQIRAAETDHSAVRTADSPEVQLLTVTKFFPASDAAALYDAGVRLYGENRDQEAGPKAAALAAIEEPDAPARWEFIGQLQTNKAKSVVRYAHAVQSVDRPSLADALAKAYTNQLSRYEAGDAPAPAAHANGNRLDCLIQVSLAEQATAGHAAEGARGGTSSDDLLALAERIESSPVLRCAGIMAVAPLGEDPNAAFERLWSLAQVLRAEHPGATEISAGMSGDMEAAVRWGSTCVRVGSAIMGARSYT